MVFIAANRIALFKIVFEKIDVKVRVRIRANFEFYATVDLLC